MKSKNPAPRTGFCREALSEGTQQGARACRDNAAEIIQAQTGRLRLKVATFFVAVLLVLFIGSLRWVPNLADAILTAVAFAVWRLAKS